MTSSILADNGTASTTARHIIGALKQRLEREKAMRARLEELKTGRAQHALTVLLPAERAYQEARRVDFGYDAAITELERALAPQKEG